MRLLKTALCVCLCLVLFAGCSLNIQGIGNVVDAVKPVNLKGEICTKTFLPSNGFHGEKLNFENISFSGTEKAEVCIIPSEETRVEAKYPADMEDHGFRVYFREGEIEISVPKQTSFSAEVFQVMVYADIEEIEISGSIGLEMDASAASKIDMDIEGGADIRIYNINADLVKTEAKGAIAMELSGKTKILETELEGAGSIDAKKLICRKAEVKISGAGAAEISVTEELFADIDGVGSLEYYGSPKVNNISGGLTDLEQVSKQVFGG